MKLIIKNKIFVLLLLLVILTGCVDGGINNNSTYQPAKTIEKPIVENYDLQKAEDSNKEQPGNQNNSNLSNDDYYVNSNGNQVHSPAYAPSIPVGATAKCRDGTYSFSQSRRGTCSHHGGVAAWY